MDFKKDLYNLMMSYVSESNWERAIDQAVLLRHLKLNYVETLNVQYVIERYKDVRPL